jgi:hypothetical protein
MGTAVVLDAIEEEEEVKPDYPFSLLLTDGTVYQGYTDFGGYLEGIRTMVEKITKSGKFTPEEKAQKITSLLKANSKQIEALPTLYKIQLKGALIGEGSDLPKVLGDQLDQEISEEL